MTPSLEGSPTKAKEAPSPHEVRLTLLETNPVFQCLGDNNLLTSFRLPKQIVIWSSSYQLSGLGKFDNIAISFSKKVDSKFMRTESLK